jgi:serine phosphatase RsbU (regulator of sigma subunit)
MAQTSRWIESDLDGMLPMVASTACELCGFRVSAELRGAAGEHGGDFYILAAHAPGRIGIVIGDACGNGVEGEAQLASILPRARELACSGLSPSRLLLELNRLAVLDLPLDRFITAVALELDVDDGVLIAASAAHVPPLVRRAENVSMACLHAGSPLGFSIASTYVDERHDLIEGDLIVLMTDGILEAIETDLLEMSATRRLFAAAPEGARGVHRLFLRKVDERTRGRRTDDMTLLAVEALPKIGASNANGLLQVG